MSCPIVNFAKQLIRCPSINPIDAGCQVLMIKRLQKIGFVIERINFGDTENFWAWRGYGKTLAFSGHTDVVHVGDIHKWLYPPFEPTIYNGMLFGRGAADMKGSLAAMIIAAERFIAQYPNHSGRLAFLITSDEEGNATHGTIKIVQMLVDLNEYIDYCIIGEPSSIKIVGDVIKNGRRGSLNCDLIIHGIQGHVAYPYLADNPIHRAIPMLNELISVQWDNGNEYFPPTNMQIVNIMAGLNSNNIIPCDLHMKLNFRFSTVLTENMIKERLVTILKKYQLRYTINWKISGRPFFTHHGKLVDAVLNTIIQYNKKKPQLLTTGGTSDGRFITRISKQIIELGLVNATIHKVNECIKITDLQLLTLMYQHIMEQLISV